MSDSFERVVVTDDFQNSRAKRNGLASGRTRRIADAVKAVRRVEQNRADGFEAWDLVEKLHGDGWKVADHFRFVVCEGLAVVELFVRLDSQGDATNL